MPPEQNDQRDRQLEALRRYVSGLTVQRERSAVAPPRPPPVKERRRPGWHWMLLTLLLMAVSLAGGVAIGAGRAGEPGSEVAGVTITTSAAVGVAATPECVEAVQAANKSIGHAIKIEGALREHTRIVNALLDGRIDVGAARETVTPSLITGSGESAKFDLALADYRRVVDSCMLRAP
jgi:hypothetical protein